MLLGSGVLFDWLGGECPWQARGRASLPAPPNLRSTRVVCEIDPRIPNRHVLATKRLEGLFPGGTDDPERVESGDVDHFLAHAGEIA